MPQQRKIQKALKRLVQTTNRSQQQLNCQQQHGLLRTVLLSSFRKNQAGFVLPTTTLLILVVTLVVAALLWRTSIRTQQVQEERKQQVIYNAATPVLDRARSKLEYLFSTDNRFPGGIPGENLLVDLMLDQGSPQDRYTLNGETRIDINGDGQLDNAWFYSDEQGNRVAYSILMETPTANQGEPHPLENTSNEALQNRANNLEVRNGPLIIGATTRPGCQGIGQGTDSDLEAGWFEGPSTARLYKNFQVNVFVTNNDPNNINVATLELEQDRQLDKGNKWGAWFRNDLEIHPGDQFLWNGAMHTEGSLIVDRLEAFLISSPASCLFDNSASEISVAKNINFTGQILVGRTVNNQVSGSATIHLYDPPQFDGDETSLTPTTDSVDTATPNDVALNPNVLFTTGQAQHNGGVIAEDANWEGSPLDRRRINRKSTPAPYIDDTYRADNRYGPNPLSDEYSAQTVGATIDAAFEELIRTKPQAIALGDSNFQSLGLDGYWERRADAQGLRIIVGERLELGNAFGWQGVNDTNPDPLHPSQNCGRANRCNEFEQYRTLRDNLAAVQGTVLYHAGDGTDIAQEKRPIACLATTSHPGTAQTIRNSTDFSGNLIDADQPDTNFLIGKGTNGWEFDLPPDDPTANADWNNALSNLAYFAGDPDAAFVDGSEDPNPQMTMWGNFSNLRRALSIDEATGNDSLADRSYIDSASCTLGMLAHNLLQLENYVYEDNNADLLLLNARLEELNDGTAVPNNGEVEIDPINNVVNIYFTGTDITTATAPDLQVPYDAETTTPPPPEAYLAVLEKDARDDPGDADKQKLAKLARLVNLKEQVQEDRANQYAGVALGANTDNSNWAGDATWTVGCNITTANYFGSTIGNNAAHGLGMLCPTQPKYPALYYIFPTSNHADGEAGEPVGNRAGNIPSENDGDIYQVVDLAEIALSPKAVGDWTLPNQAVSNRVNQIVDPSGDDLAVAFLDKGIYNGREAMSVRVLDIDLDLLKTSDSGLTDDLWLPHSGIIYAFREDTRRDPTPVNFYADPNRRTHGFRLRNGADLSRPAPDGQPARGLSLISDNPVYIQGDFNLHSNNGTTNNLEEFTNTLDADWGDFYDRTEGERNAYPSGAFADPAQDTWRPTEILADAITILSGNFCDGSIEDGFRYTNQANPNLPGFYGCNAAARYTSYMGINRPNNVAPDWAVENPYAELPSDNSDLNPYPIKIDRDGVVVQQDNTTFAGAYRGFGDADCGRPDRRKCIGNPNNTQVNAILVQGIIPSRQNQPYGGLHNFPRTIEFWQNQTLSISGAFLQLNFSTYATGPFDQDAWEETVATSPSGTFLGYYWPPVRRWGYDVALQLAPVGPVAERLTTAGNIRSEFYQEPDLDDPYILKLRCAQAEGGTVDPNVDGSLCE